MKLYFKTFVAFLMMSLALVSCNDNFDEDEARVSYPDNFGLGIWANEYTEEGGMSYTLNFTLNEAGDTICDVTMFNTATGDANVLSAGKVSYDKTTGVISASYTESPWGTEALVTVSYKNNIQTMTVNLYSLNGGKLASKGVFTAIQAQTISVYGDWKLANGTFLSLAPDGTATVSVAEGEAEKGTYTFEGGKVVVKTASGMVIEMELNSLGQMFATVGGQQVYAQHIMTQPKNDWYEYAVGQYNNWLFGPIDDRVLEYSPSRKMARIQGFSPVPGSAPLTFYWTIGEAKVAHAESSYDTGYDHVQDGQMLGRVFAQPAVITEDGATALFDAEKQAFFFGHTYLIPGVGGFGANTDAFAIQEIIAAE